MGGGASRPAKVQRSMKKASDQKLVKLMMPVYYCPEAIAEAERLAAIDSWGMILKDTSPEYQRLKAAEDFQYLSCMTYFYDMFYERLFDVHPSCRSLFKSGMRSQGKFLVQMISLSLSELTQPEQFDRTLVRLAERHFDRGVKAVEYGIVGEVLMYALKLVLGPTVYTPFLHLAWVKIYSRMLTTIIPVAVALELKPDARPQTERTDNKEETRTFASQSSVSISVPEEPMVLKCEKMQAAIKEESVSPPAPATPIPNAASSSS